MKNSLAGRLLPYLLIALTLCILPAMMQVHLKKMPQLFMLILSAAVIVSFFMRRISVIRVLFYILFAFILFINIEQLIFNTAYLFDINMSLFNFFCNGCSPAHGGLILGNFVGMPLAPYLVWRYHQKTKDYSMLFPYCMTACYFTVTLVIYIIYEVL